MGAIAHTDTTGPMIYRWKLTMTLGDGDASSFFILLFSLDIRIRYSESGYSQRDLYVSMQPRSDQRRQNIVHLAFAYGHVEYYIPYYMVYVHSVYTSYTNGVLVINCKLYSYDFDTCNWITNPPSSRIHVSFQFLYSTEYWFDIRH